MARSFLLVLCGVSSTVVFYGATPAQSDIIVDPYHRGATDVVLESNGSATLLTNPVADPLVLAWDRLAVGNTTDGELAIQNGGVVNSDGNAIIGNNTGSSGIVTVDGIGSDVLFNKQGAGDEQTV